MGVGPPLRDINNLLQSCLPSFSRTVDCLCSWSFVDGWCCHRFIRSCGSDTSSKVACLYVSLGHRSRLPSYTHIDVTISFHSGGIRGSYVHSKCGFGMGLSQNGCGLALVACSLPSGSSITRSSTLIFDDVGWQYSTFGSLYCASRPIIGDSCSFIVIGVLPAVALFVAGSFLGCFSVFVGGISPLSRMSLHSSSGIRSACTPSGRDGLL
jgi:hypothetical protein